MTLFIKNDDEYHLFEPCCLIMLPLIYFIILMLKNSESNFIIKTEIVCPNDANPMGILQGGKLVQWMDIAAAVCAQTYSKSICVTASINEISFLKSAKVGDIITIKAIINKAFNTSMEIKVEAFSRSISQVKKYLISKSFFIFVCIDENGKPTPIQTKSNQPVHLVSKQKNKFI